MGKPAQQGIVRKLDLERFLSEVRPNPSPKAGLEQYTITEKVAAELLYLAAYPNEDIVGKKVLDLGCGTGRLALGAAFLGAKTIVGVDIDKRVVIIASATAEKTGLEGKTHWIAGDVEAISGKFDTVVQNPPFGVQKRGADRRFLQKALEVGNSVYSLHNHPRNHERDMRLICKLKASRGRLLQVEGSSFVKRFVKERGGIVLAVYALLMPIPRMFQFHKEIKREAIIDLYVIRKISRNEVALETKH